MMKNNNKEIDQKNIDEFVEDFEIKQKYKEEEEQGKENQSSLKSQEEENKNINEFEETIE